MVIIGVTGGFGTGKTTVANLFKEKGAVVLDADKIAHKVLEKKSSLIKRHFGEDICSSAGKIERKKLAEKVFTNKILLDKLCRFIHPDVKKEILNTIDKIRRSNSDVKAVVLDIPLLIEAGYTDIIDRLVVVKTTRDVQIRRCLKKGCLDKKDVLARIRAQLPISRKVLLADFVIDNNGKLEKTKREVEKIWEAITQVT